MNVQTAKLENGSFKETQGNAVLMRLREMILTGALPSGRRITETFLSDLLGVSRTPIRQALPVLARDRLIEGLGAGYVVREIPHSEILECVEIRGLLESAAVKALAEDGAPRRAILRLNQIIKTGDEILGKGFIVEEDRHSFHAMNESFHAVIVEESGRPVLIDTIERLNVGQRGVPSLAFSDADHVAVYQFWCLGHQQHRMMVRSIEKGDGFRAAAIAREHMATQTEALEQLMFHS